MVISICNEKGGSGKSTLATNIAIYEFFAKENYTWLIDSDPQRSIATFLNIRNDENLEKAFHFSYKNGDALKTMLSDTIFTKNSLIVDTGGRDSREMRIAIALSDIVLIPTIPSQFDISVLDMMVERLKQAKELNPKLKAFIVINRASPNPFLSKKIESLKKYIKELECDYITLAKTIIHEREAYKIATQMGMGVFEMDKNSKASLEIHSLCEEIYKGQE